MSTTSSLHLARSSARNLILNDKVAIKKIAGAFENVIDAKRTLREIKLVRHLQHENIVQIKDIIPPTNRANFRDVYVVYELMDTDLHQIIRSPQPLSDDHVQYFLYQVRLGPFSSWQAMVQAAGPCSDDSAEWTADSFPARRGLYPQQSYLASGALLAHCLLWMHPLTGAAWPQVHPLC